MEKKPKLSTRTIQKLMSSSEQVKKTNQKCLKRNNKKKKR